MVQIDLEYQGDLHCEAKHGPSGMTLATDAPLDNQGRGEAFSPTDLVATALGACVMTIMGIYADREGVFLEGMKVHVEKVMTKEPPRRVARISLVFTMPPNISPKHRQCLERCVEACPVRRTLHPDVEVPVRFIYPDQTSID